MKLHLPKGIRTALIACVCCAFAVAEQAVAEDTIVLTDTTYTATVTDGTADTPTDLTTLWSSYTTDESYISSGIFAKAGDGVLNVDSSDILWRVSEVQVNDGTLRVSSVNSDAGAAFTNTKVSVGAGATLQLAVESATGTNDSAINEIVLTGSSDGLATLQLDANQTLAPTDIKMNGYSSITGDGTLTFTGAKLTSNSVWTSSYLSATGTNNTISSKVMVNWNVNMDVAAGGELTLTGGIGQANAGAFVKTGDGKLTIAGNSGCVANNIAFEVKGGTLELNSEHGTGVGSGISVAEGATLLLSAQNALGWGAEVNGVKSTPTITLTGDSSTAQALMVVNAQNAITGELQLNGYTSVTGTSHLIGLDKNGGNTISVTGTNNTINVKLSSQYDTTIHIAENAELTLSGSLNKKADGVASDQTFTGTYIKTGAGTLILSSFTVASDATLIADDGKVRVDSTKDFSVTLRGAELNINCDSLGVLSNNTGTITLANEADENSTTTSNTISAAGKALFADVTGTGNLTLDGKINVYADMDFTGNLTIQNSGDTKIGYDTYGHSPTIANDGDITIDSTATVYVNSRNKTDDGSGDTDNAATTMIQNTGDIYVKGTLSVDDATVGSSSTDGLINVQGGTLAVTDSTTLTSDVVVSTTGSGDTLKSGVLDLSNVTTLQGEGLDISLEEGATLKLGSGILTSSIEFSGTLSIADGTIIDLSWMTIEEFNSSHYMMELFSYTGSGVAALDGDAWTLDSLNGVDVMIQFAENVSHTGQLVVANGKVHLIPEPTTATLSLLALAGLCARRRRK